MNNLIQDIRYALGTLTRAPGFATIAIITLALGIGANTAIFSLVHAIILKPLPYRDPVRLIAIWDTYFPDYSRIGVSPTEIAAWSAQTDLFESSAWYRYVPKNYSLAVPGSEPLEVHATVAPAELFTTLGVHTAAGRAFTVKEDPHSVLLSDKLWRTRFGADRNILGKPIRLNDEAFTVVGIMPADFAMPDWADAWVSPGQLNDELTNPVRHAAGFIARLRPGVTEGQARVQLESIAKRLAAEHPKTSHGFGMKLAGLQQDLTANVRPSLLMILGAVALVLLIACGNVANLLLARASGRTREFAIRSALGAGAGRIVRQLLTESLVLSLLGGLAGLAMARWGLTAFAPTPVPLHSTVLLFLLVITLITGVAFGPAPALEALRGDPITTIKASAMPGSGRSAIRSSLIVAEFALAVVLVIGAGILAKSFVRLMQVEPGFQPRGLLTLRLSVPPSRKPDVLFHRIEDSLRSLPGFESAAFVNTLPLIANRATASRFNVPGSPLIDPNALPSAQLRFVTPEYFHTMGIPFRSGRAFTEREVNDPIVVINAAMAQRFWPGRDPVGLKFVTGVWGPTPFYSTIAGVVANVKQFGLDSEPTMDLYFPGFTPTYLIVRTSADPSAIAEIVRRKIAEIDPDLPVSDVHTMDQVIAVSAQTRRAIMALMGAFSGLALVLALVGIYGVMSWSVAQRTREIGIRMALGAQTSNVQSMVIGYSMRLCALGLAAGVIGSFALRQVLASLVFGVSTSDPLIYAAAVSLMLAVALLACYIPSRRASRIDPLLALRDA